VTDDKLFKELVDNAHLLKSCCAMNIQTRK